MEALFYQTQDLDLQPIAQALELEYQAKGYEAQHFGDPNNVTEQLKQESTLRMITGFNKEVATCLKWEAGLLTSDQAKGPPNIQGLSPGLVFLRS